MKALSSVNIILFKSFYLIEHRSCVSYHLVCVFSGTLEARVPRQFLIALHFCFENLAFHIQGAYPLKANNPSTFSDVQTRFLVWNIFRNNSRCPNSRSNVLLVNDQKLMQLGTYNTRDEVYLETKRKISNLFFVWQVWSGGVCKGDGSGGVCKGEVRKVTAFKVAKVGARRVIFVEMKSGFWNKKR